MPPKKGTRAGKAQGGGKDGSSGNQPSLRKKLPSGPVIFAWILAVIFLSSLLYFSKDYNPGKPKLSSGEKVSQTPSRPQPAPAPAGKEQGRPAVKGDSSVQPKPQVPRADAAKPSGKRDSEEPLAVAMNKPAPTPPPVPPPPTKPKAVLKAAIVIDDFGPDIEAARKFIALPFAVTLSIIPYQKHSRDIAELAHSQHREILLHCPMEPLGYPKVNPGKGALFASMSRDQMRRNLGTALDTSPYFSGLNNHEGSRMTQDAEAMKTFMVLLKEHNLFFLDSMTTPDSKAWSSAREQKIPTRKRDIFLDHDPSPAAVRAQISRLISIAKVQGTALAVGHPHEATLKALQEAGALFRKEGLEIVPASELMSSR
ncbi:MAG: divergent polysaccharide deacetylase family protein [Desulfobacteraceae bacterium]|nr:divergent polysaccharide deacetylase family protein [Desulfobacteraceae bacterium]